MSAPSNIVPDRQEVFSSFYGAYRLACLDVNGMSFFNVTVEGFWRSFFVAVVLVPFYMLSISPDVITAQGSFSFWAALVHLLTYALSWVIFPLVAFFATDLLNLGHRFTALVVAVNWSSLPILGVATFVILFAALVQGAVANLLAFVVISGLIVYHWFVIKTALRSTALVATVLLLFKFVSDGMLILASQRFL